VTPFPVPRPSNRTCGFPASGSHPGPRDFALGWSERQLTSRDFHPVMSVPLSRRTQQHLRAQPPSGGRRPRKLDVPRQRRGAHASTRSSSPSSPAASSTTSSPGPTSATSCASLPSWPASRVLELAPCVLEADPAEAETLSSAWPPTSSAPSRSLITLRLRSPNPRGRSRRGRPNGYRAQAGSSQPSVTASHGTSSSRPTRAPGRP
jgi:hypothetical protein